MLREAERYAFRYRISRHYDAAAFLRALADIGRERPHLSQPPRLSIYGRFLLRSLFISGFSLFILIDLFSALHSLLEAC